MVNHPHRNKRKAEVEALRAGLEPFARYYDVLREMGGNTPKRGPYCVVESSVAGTAEITVEDLAEARRLLDTLAVG